MRSTKTLVRADGKEVALPSKCDDIEVEKDDILYYNTWGGAGWGNPLERDADKVALEVKRGLIGIEGARSYGVVINDDFSIDVAATDALRVEMAPTIKTDQIFNLGPSMDELRANCLKETGLEAPIQPTWG